MRYLILVFLPLIVVSSCKSVPTKKYSINKINSICTSLNSGHSNLTAIIFPGLNEDLLGNFEKNKVIMKLLNEGYDLYIIDNSVQSNLFYDSSESNQILSLIDSLSKVGRVKENSLVLGGFSIGGISALECAISLIKGPEKSLIKGVFIIDSPLDYIRFFESVNKLASSCKNELAKNEASFVLGKLLEHFGCPPTDCKDEYWRQSVFSKGDIQFKRYGLLKDIKVLLFANTAFQWQKKYRDRDSIDLHFTDIKGLYDSLSRISHKVEISINDSSFSKEDNPHSWNKIDISKFSNWLKN